ncbi:hypothetical protein [Bacillus taeanensis]|uniref:YtxH domain-containing protein n=1 Tax=Bacillus taeanensis TaxID=273032 RepID=A0A366XZD7_9BACI|nr:hypothetical protein [Bacillus taeanensis]RBW69524.1 hypothetical protein DS031_11425 [Bacillus taeanensis]
MRKRDVLLSTSVAVGAVGASVLLKDKDKRAKVKETIMKGKDKLMDFRNQNEKSLPIEKAGKPDPQNIRDNKMVSEGSVYPVQYYNEHKQQ